MSSVRRRRGGHAVVAVAALVVLPGLAACESSQTRSARLEAKAGTVTGAQQGLTIAQPSKELTAATVTTLTGEQGTAAVVVEVKNDGAQDAFGVPILISVKDDSGTEIFANSAPGLQPSLTMLAAAPRGATTAWVNDQVPYTGSAPLTATATIGDPAGAAPTTPPVTFTTSRPRLEQDPVSGVAAKGYVKSDSDAEQQRVLVTVLGRKGDAVVAAGRAIVERVKPGKRAVFTAFLVGDPQGAELTATAAPSMEEGAALSEEATSTP